MIEYGEHFYAGGDAVIMAMMTVYHGGYQAVKSPEIRIGRNNKDFGNGFYCTVIKEQAESRLYSAQKRH